MYKSMYEEVTRQPYELDERDKEILAARTEVWDKRDGPRVGDYVITSSGVLRFTHDWGDTIQTTSPKFGYGSFHLDRTGHMSYSGALDPGVDKSRLTPTDEIRAGRCWFFSHDYQTAHNGVDVMVPCRVYRLEGDNA